MPVPPSKTVTVRLRLGDLAPAAMGTPSRTVAEILSIPLREADEFYKSITPERSARMTPSSGGRRSPGWCGAGSIFLRPRQMAHGTWRGSDEVRRMLNPNSEWFHMVNQHVISMPDKWEYPWYAAWDLAFHTIALCTVDLEFAKQQLDPDVAGVLHPPNRPIPAFERNFSDVNPPVHAWATIPLPYGAGHQKEKVTSSSSNVVGTVLCRCRYASFSGLLWQLHSPR